MTDRVHPKAAAASNATGSATAGPFPATKSQLYGASRPPYRPQPDSPRRRSPCCTACIWITAIFLSLLILLSIASTVIFLVYRPHRPSFSVAALTLSAFKLTTSGLLNANFALTLAANNPNAKNVKFIYSPFSVGVLSGGTSLGDGTFPAFVHGKRNTTVMKVAAAGGGRLLDGEAVGSLRSAVKRGVGLPLEIDVETKAKVKMGWLKTPRVGVRVLCDGITASVPMGKKKAVAAVISGSECKVVFRLKVWKWNI